jgi:5'-3' exonuclease
MFADEFANSVLAKTVYLVDLSWLLHRGYHAFGQLSVVIDGLTRPSGHVFGVLKPVMDIKRRDPRSVVVLCKDGRPARRDELSSYKEGRPQLSYDIHQDVNDICSIATMIPGVYFATAEDRESDDLMYSLAKKCERNSNVEKVYIFSGDNDLLQAIGGKIVVIRKWVSDRKYPLDEIDSAWVLKEFGVTPDKFALYKCVVGDSSDAVKGIPRFSRSILKDVCGKVSSIEEFIKYPFFPKNYKEKVAENVELLRRNFRLMALGEVDCVIMREDDRTHQEDLIKKWQVKSVPQFVARFN